MDEIIGLNVGGYIYTTSRSTLTRYPDSMLGNMFSDRLPSAKDSQGNVIIDRDGQVFRHILNFLRTSELVLPDDYKEFAILSKEADFYQIKELIMAIQVAKKRNNVKFEIREYEQNLKRNPKSSYYFNMCNGLNGIHTDWRIHGGYETLVALNQSTMGNSKRRVHEFSDSLIPGDNTLHINWYDEKRSKPNIAVPRSKPSYTIKQSSKQGRQEYFIVNDEEVTEKLFLELFSLGYKLESKSDTVDSVQYIDPTLTDVKLHSAKTYTLVKY